MSKTKYPLFYKWTLHYGPWNNIQNVLTVSDLEEFWSLFNNIICPKELGFKKDYHFFRHDVAPTYEDPLNAKGGCIHIDIKDDFSDKIWMHTILGVVGLNFTDYDKITGIVGSSKAGNNVRISLWVTISDDLTILQRIANEWKNIIQREHFKLQFFHHSEVKTYEPKYIL